MSWEYNLDSPIKRILWMPMPDKGYTSARNASEKVADMVGEMAGWENNPTL
jgi:hypothetical protein